MPQYTLTIDADGYKDAFTGESLVDCVREVLQVASDVQEQFPPTTFALLMQAMTNLSDLYAIDDSGCEYEARVTDPMNGESFTLTLQVEGCEVAS
jgi:hypothetical protein